MTLEESAESLMIADRLLEAASKMKSLGCDQAEIEIVERYALAKAEAAFSTDI